MVNLQLTNNEWYFLHRQIEKIIKKNLDNYIAKDLSHKLAENCPKLDDIKSEFKTEYESKLVGDDFTK